MMNSIKTEKEYRAVEGWINYSTLKKFYSNPNYCLIKDKPPTREMTLGTVFEERLINYCLGKEEREYEVAPKCRRNSKEYKAFVEANQGKEILTPDEDCMITEMMSSVLEATLFDMPLQEVIRQSRIQTPVFWEMGKIMGEPVKKKALIDFHFKYGDSLFLFDIKTTHAAIEDFKWEIKKFKYWIQAIHYREALAALDPNHSISEMHFLAISKKPPYFSAIAKIGGQTIEFAEQAYARMVEDYVFYMRKDPVLKRFQTEIQEANFQIY